ncbi:MAG: Xaa-Pro peptidase family protein [Eubacterium sp.]|nr:Xaa-Pro peptidase family protein [Eubacterium sp.]
MNEKIEKLLAAAKVDMALLTDEANMRYISGFTGEGYVLVTKDWGRIVTDSRYTIAARAECPGFDVIDWAGKGYYKPAMDAVKDKAIRTVGYEDLYMTVAQLRQFEKKLQRNAKLKPLQTKADELRQVKSAGEIERIREAEAVGDRAFARLMLDFGVKAEALGEVGRQVASYHVATPMKATQTTEKQVSAKLEFYLKDEGGERLSFDTIAASGLNGAMPHAVPTDKLLKRGELLTLDFGCVYRGYCSDMTRTVAIGKPLSRMQQIYDIVKKAQQAALDQIRPGMTGKEIDALARDVIKKEGYGEFFGHSLGHSVGLKIHERPGFSVREKTEIRPGMVVSVEPGIYVENVGGVRIEDLVAITESGVDNLASSVKDLIVIP